MYRSTVSKSIFVVIMAFFHSSCATKGPDVPTAGQLSLSPSNHFQKLVNDSKLSSMKLVSDFYKFYTVIYQSGKQRYEKKNYVMHYDKTTILISHTLYDFDIDSIPKNAMIISAKLYSYIVEGKDMLGFVQYEINNSLITDFTADIAGPWLVLDITDTVSKLISEHQSQLNLTMKMDDSGIGTGRRCVEFASSRAGSHVAPQLLVEYILKD